MISSSNSRGIYTWKHQHYTSYLAISTDDILLLTPHHSCYDELKQQLGYMFDYTTSSGEILHFLNLRIIQTTDAISFDQTQHIENNILPRYFNETTDVPYVSHPFPTDSTYEVELYKAFPLIGNDLQSIIREHNGSLAHWVGELIHVTTHSRPDLAYTTMRLSGYMACPKAPIFRALQQTMRYLYHHPHMPIIYPRHAIKDTPLKCHFSKGIAEVVQQTNTTLTNHNDADLARDIQDRRSVTCTIHTINTVAVSWKCKKQTQTALHSNGAEIRALQSGVKTTLHIRQFMATIGHPITHPTPTYEDNQATIHQVLQDRLTPQVRHLDVLITWLHEQYIRGSYNLAYEQSKLMTADVGTKPQPGKQLHQQLQCINGSRYYPQINSRHYNALHLHRYNVCNVTTTQRPTTTIPAKT